MYLSKIARVLDSSLQARAGVQCCKVGDIPPRYLRLPCSVAYLTLIVSCVCVCACECSAVVISPRTFAGGQDLGNGKGCWRRVTSWAAASPTSRWIAGEAGTPPSVQPLLPAAGKHTARYALAPAVGETKCSDNLKNTQVRGRMMTIIDIERHEGNTSYKGED